MGLRTKVTLAMSVLIALVLGVSGVFFYMTERRLHEQALQTQQEETLNSMAQIAAEGLLVQDDLLIQSYSEYLKKSTPSVLFCYVATPSKILAHSDRRYFHTAASKFSYDQAGTLSASRTLNIESMPPVKVTVVFSAKVIEANFKKLTAALFSGYIKTFLISMLLGYIAAFLLATSLIRPVEKVAAALKTAGEGDLDVRLNLDRDDEIGYLAAEFNSMTARLRELDRMKEDFTSAVTHELKSPLSAIESYLDLMLYELKQGGVPIAKFETDIKYVKQNTSRLFRFISDVLDVGKIHKGKFDVKKAPFRLETLIDDVVKLFRERADSLGIALNAAAKGKTLVLADEERIRQVLINLVSNSLKFTPALGTITVALSANGSGSATVSVADTGVGIPPADIGRVFGLFEQGKTSPVHLKSPKGTGLGLFIAKSIVEAHDGRIWAESSPENGTKISFTVELAEAAHV